jgi:hypothetical protein
MKSGSHITRIFILLGISILISCQKEKLNGLITNDEILLTEIYNQSQDTVDADGLSVILLMDVYYSFTPGSIPVGKKKDYRITAHATLLEIDSLTIENTFEINELYLIKEKDIWISNPKIDDAQYESFKLNTTSLNGPEWNTGTEFDAFIELIETSTFDKYILSAKNQKVYKVE